ncbi:MAG: hypothetical protein P8105_06265 [Dehalococcoidia bacterium]
MTDMVRITLVPDTSHCIETVAKMEYRELMHSCLRTGTADAYSAEKMELLHDFLEAADFKALRKQSDEYLLEGKNVSFTIYRDKDALKWEMVHGE